uniref:Receptor-type tyrosine-protein phosphatase F n=1 Tax=Nothobranchius kadleci TaxID=1051664 RepID=A0A1A8EFP8_NOTKA
MHRARPTLLLLPLLLIQGLLLHLADADSPPKFLRTPNDQTGVQGGVASFICQATGDPRPKIVWNKKGKKVSNQRFEVIEFDDGSGSVLRIQPLRTPRDEAIYECVASNSVGETSATTRLTVLREDQLPPGFPTIDMGPQLKVVERTRTATMLCAASGNPDPDISWFKDFLPVNTTNNIGRIKQLRSESFGGTPIRGALQIEQSEESDQGKYECVAMNSAGTRYSAPANLYVRVRRVPPRFSIPPTNQEVMPGGSVNLTCVAVGSPMPYVKWTTGQVELTKEDEMPLGRNVLEVTNIRESANYTCVAISSLGMIDHTAQVTVKALPKPPTSLTVTETTATSVTLTWDSGNPEPVSFYMIQYRAKVSDNGYQEVEGVATTRYSIGGLSPYSEYEFRVMAVNNIGKGPPSDPVETRTGEQAPSSPPLQIQARMLSASTMLVQWEPPEEPNGQIRGYRVYYSSDMTAPLSAWQKHNTDDSSLTTISGLIPDITYSLRVLGFTSVGDGPPSDILQVKTQQGVPAQPTSFDAEAELDTRIKLTWLWPVQDPITNYELLYWEAGSSNKKHVTFNPAGSYVVEDLKPDTLYHFSLAARSEMGLGVYTQPIEARTAQSMPGAPPRKLEVEAINSTAIRVTWKPPLQMKQHGQIRGYQVIYSRLENGEPRGQPNIMDVALPEAQEAVIGGLHSETTYSVTVAAYTTKGDGARSKAKVITTTGAVPGKPTMMINPTSSNTALIQWQSPTEMVGELMGFQLQYKRTDEQVYTSREMKKTDDHYTVTGLHKGATYVFRLSARNRAGIGEAYVKEVSTAEDKPSGFPLNLKVTGLTQSSTKLTWEPPLLSERNGKIVHYLVVYRDINNQQDNTSRTTNTDMTIEGLSPDTTYDIRVQAFTSMGGGPLSPSIQSRTMSNDFPTLNFGVKAVMKTSVLLTWDLPENYKSQTLFKILYNQQSVEVDGSQKRKLITQLQPDTNYSFVLTSRGNIAGGLQQQVSIRTAPDLIKTKPGTQAHGGKLTITLPTVQTTSRVRWYYIVVVPQTSTTPRWNNPDEMDLDELLRSSDGPVLRRRRHLDSVKAYIAAKLPSLNKTFTLGDEKRYNGFFNRPLINQQAYLCFVLAVLQNEGTDSATNYMTFSASPYSERIQISTNLPQGMDQPEMLWVMGPVLAVIVIIIIVIAILLFKNKQERKRASPLPKDEHSGGVKDSLLANSSDPVEMRRLNYQTPGPSSHRCPNTPRMREHPPIPVIDLADHIERLKANDGLRFSQEYESIDPGQQFTWENSNMEVNKPKNRYANVIAYDHSRVVLTSVDAVPGSDYINANYIDGYRKQNAYIATQGPLAETFGDFWRMVWEWRCHSIVMLTELKEREQEKCFQYWPSEGSMTFGDYTVELTGDARCEPFTRRDLVLTKKLEKQSQHVRHIHFHGWPEIGTPAEGRGMIDIIAAVQRHQQQSGNRPIVVHCSAGAGRTGTFIALSNILERVKAEGLLDVFQTVKSLRMQRPHMVQTMEQYDFCYRVVQDFIDIFSDYANFK